MIDFAVTLIFFSIGYAIFIGWCYAGWNKLSVYRSSPATPTTMVTVIVPARNEERYIESCLTDLVRQSYPATLFEVIVADDHSTDHTASIVTGFIQRFPQHHISLIHHDQKISGSSYKKHSISTAVRQSSGELIITLDADCNMGVDWLHTIVSFYEREHPSLIAGPVCFHEGRSRFAQLQSLEFMGLIGIGAAAIANQLPVMCNGANLAYTKKVFNEVNGFDGEIESASGDDTQLMLKIAKRAVDEVHFLKSDAAIVYTHALNSINGLWQQRKRWASKIPGRMSGFTLLIAVVAWVLHAGLMITGIFSIFGSRYIPLFVFLFLMKSIPEFIFLRSVSLFFRRRQLLWLFLPAQFFYAGYIFIVGIMAPFTSYRWKERVVKSGIK